MQRSSNTRRSSTCTEYTKLTSSDTHRSEKAVERYKHGDTNDEVGDVVSPVLSPHGMSSAMMTTHLIKAMRATLIAQVLNKFGVTKMCWALLVFLQRQSLALMVFTEVCVGLICTDNLSQDLLNHWCVKEQV